MCTKFANVRRSHKNCYLNDDNKLAPLFRGKVSEFANHTGNPGVIISDEKIIETFKPVLQSIDIITGADSNSIMQTKDSMIF